MKRCLGVIAAVGVSALLSGNAMAASCQNSGNFDGWLATFKVDAAKQGVTPRTIQSALAGMTVDQNIINTDRGQRFLLVG